MADFFQYHDDGETSLGPTIATLSLGGPSEMKIRMKEKYFRGQSKSGKLLAHDPVLDGCLFSAERQALKEEFENGELSIEEYHQFLRETLKGCHSREARACVTLHLRHGDIVVMNGECFQKYYEVCLPRPRVYGSTLTTNSIRLRLLTNFALL